MADELQSFISRLVRTVEGLECVVVSDRDGVMLIEAHVDNIRPAVTKPQFLGVFSIASEQASKLGLGKNKSVISYYSNHQVVQFNYNPLVVTFVALAEANTGLIFGLEKDLNDAVSDLQSAVSVP